MPFRFESLHGVSVLVCLETCWGLSAGQINEFLGTVLVGLGMYWLSFFWSDFMSAVVPVFVMLRFLQSTLCCLSLKSISVSFLVLLG